MNVSVVSVENYTVGGAYKFTSLTFSLYGKQRVRRGPVRVGRRKVLNPILPAFFPFLSDVHRTFWSIFFFAAGSENRRPAGGNKVGIFDEETAEMCRKLAMVSIHSYCFYESLETEHFPSMNKSTGNISGHFFLSHISGPETSQHPTSFISYRPHWFISLHFELPGWFWLFIPGDPEIRLNIEA